MKWVLQTLLKNEMQSAPLLFLSSRFMAYAPSFILGKLSLGKIQFNLIEILSSFDIA